MSGASFLDMVGPQYWPGFAMLSARVSGLLLVAPVWSMRAIPRTVRGAFAVVLTVSLLPTVPETVAPQELLALPIAMGSELLFGLAIGLAAGLFVYAVQVAAEVIAVQMGLSIASILSPTSTGGPPGMAELQNLMALAVYVTLDGHLLLLVGLSSSLHTIRLGVSADVVTGGTALVAIAGGLFSSAVRVAAPVMVALVLTNMALGITGKAVPQLNVLMLAFPITIGVGLLVFGAALPFLASLFTEWVENIPIMIESLAAAFAPVPAVR
jgi:flagellar biosynthetic protein FliR